MKLKPLIARRARASQARKPKSVIPKSGRQTDNKTDEQLAKIAGVGGTTIYEAALINDKADEATKERLRRGETSINAEYTKIRLSAEQKRRAKTTKNTGTE